MADDQQPNTGGEPPRDRGRPAGSPEVRNIRSAVRTGAEAGSEAVRQEARAAEEGSRDMGNVMRRSGEAAAETTQHGAEVGAEILHRASDATSATARRSAHLLAASQRELAHGAADQFEQIGLKLGEAARESADNLRSMMVMPNPFGTGLRDLQQGVSSLVEGVVRTNLRATQEFFRLANPGAVIDLQRRFVRDYFGALMEGSAVIARAVHRSAEETLRPLEEQIEESRTNGHSKNEQQHQARKVADVMSPDVRVASPEDTVQQAARLMRKEDTGVLPVGEGDRLVGMVTDRDVALRLAAEGKNPAQTKVREVMTPEVRYVFEDEDIRHVADNMAQQQLRRLPVVNRQKRLVGMISLSDISRKGQLHHLAGRALGGIAREGGLHSQTAAE
jgi:CBS domain-containing protein